MVEEAQLSVPHLGAWQGCGMATGWLTSSEWLGSLHHTWELSGATERTQTSRLALAGLSVWVLIAAAQPGPLSSSTDGLSAWLAW